MKVHARINAHRVFANLRTWLQQHICKSVKLFSALRVRTTITSLVLMGIGLLVTPGQAIAQCPAVGQDTACGIIITVTDSGATITATGQGPYDGIEDTLIGVVNKSRLPVSALGLKSGRTIFGFDGDGIDTFGIAGNARDSTGYGGPNAFFTDISADQTSGTVNFITPIAAKGGTAFFSLEEALTSATACSTLINHAVPKPSGGGTQISTTFTPKLGFTLAQAAQLCGFIEFDWQQTITSLPLPSPFFAAGSTTPLHAPPPFNDPPPGGYAYQTPPNAVGLPVYYNLFTPASNPLSLAANQTATTLSFFDAPADSCLPGGSGAPCGGHTAPRGSKLAFRTHLVGIQGFLPGANVVDTGIGFAWTDTYNGTSGGISVINSATPVDPGSGTGEIEVTSFNDVTTLQDVNVTAVNGVTPGAIPVLTSGTACNGVFSGDFTGDVIVSSGQNCTFVNGTIGGNVQNNGGSLVLSGVLISGEVLIKNGPFSIDSFTEIDGSLNVHHVPVSDSSSQICDATVLGNVEVHNNQSAIQIGSPDASVCGGNVLVGNVEVHTNAGATMLFANTVSGNLHDHNNSGPTQVFNNTVVLDLQCDGNTAITGAANNAAGKTGQCVAF
jgi:hypothetical protein